MPQFSLRGKLTLDDNARLPPYASLIMSPLTVHAHGRSKRPMHGRSPYGPIPAPMRAR